MIELEIHKVLSYFQNYINEQVDIIKSHKYSNMLSEAAVAAFESFLDFIIIQTADSTLNKMLADKLLPENPLVAADIKFALKEQLDRALKELDDELESGEKVIPKPLHDILTKRIGFTTDAFLEMLTRITENREAICDVLNNGEVFTRIDELVLSAGDTHNCGRKVAIVVTDKFRFVYKPHNMRGDSFVYRLVNRFFPDVIGIPKCIAFDDKFGVSEFIEMHRSEGEAAAEKFYRNFGGAAAVMKLFGISDIHIENIICADDKPYLVDLETVFSPIVNKADLLKYEPELLLIAERSLYLSGLMPSSYKGREHSPLMSTADDGCAPEINGHRVTVRRFLKSFSEGYRENYERIIRHRADIYQMLEDCPVDMPIRVIIRNTQYYYDTVKRLYHHNTLASDENQKKTSDVLVQHLVHYINPDFRSVVPLEQRQMERGDIPYVYTYADSSDLFSDGEIAVKNILRRSAKQHFKDTLSIMGEDDKAFDLTLIERCITQYPMVPEIFEPLAFFDPELTDEALTKEEALAEAGKIFSDIKKLAVPYYDGTLMWGRFVDGSMRFAFCDHGLSDGLMGISVFLAGYAMLSGSPEAAKLADTAISQEITKLERLICYIKEKDYSFDFSPELGESRGMGGVLKGLALLKRYTSIKDIESYQEKALDLLEHLDLERYGAPDRMMGMAGLLSVLCRFDEYRGKTALIRKAADRIIRMKELKYSENLLWKPIPDIKRPLSGAGHGLVGIAEALAAAANVLNDSSFNSAINDALQFELSAYKTKLGTWGDMRELPVRGYMHGYCSGAPGIGIMLESISENGYENDEVKKSAELAANSVSKLPLNQRDHLCCGNSAVAEYYIRTGRLDEAGRVLKAMKKRSEQTGEYRMLSYKHNNSQTPSLFYGICGVGYEMLRYVSPEKILPVI